MKKNRESLIIKKLKEEDSHHEQLNFDELVIKTDESPIETSSHNKFILNSDLNED